VTVESYTQCVAAGSCEPAAGPGSVVDRLARCNYGVLGRELHPINCVRWDDASQYCRWRGRRLPTEEEWMFATQRGTRRYPWGTSDASAAHLNLLGDEWSGKLGAWGDDGFIGTAPVKSFPQGATSEGIYDLLGNVWELLSSKLCPDGGDACVSCPSDEACESGCGACVTPYRAVRGAGWEDPPDMGVVMYHRGASLEGPYGGRTDYIGFRCALSDAEASR